MSRVRVSLTVFALVAALPLGAAPRPAASSPLGLRYTATAGPVYAPGPNAADLGNALGLQLEGSRPAGLMLEWFGTFSYHDFGGLTLPEIYIDWGSEALYLPEYSLDQPYRGYGFEFGLRRRFRARGLDLFVEGAAGIAYSEQPPAGSRLANDRRPAPPESNDTDVAGTGASFSLGAGGVVARNGRVGLVTAVSAHWQSALGVSGPLVPVRLGLTWPVEPAAVAEVRAGVDRFVTEVAGVRPRGPSLRLGAGTAWMAAPEDVWDASIPAAGFSAGVDAPLGPWLSLRLDGAQSLFVSTQAGVLREELDPFGNLQTYYSTDTPHWTVTFFTAGLAASASRGAWSPYLHAGAGLARTGGDGNTIQVAVPSQPPTEQTVQQGFGYPETGFAWTGGAGLEYAVAPAWSVYLEGTLQGVTLDAPDVQVFTLRTGVVLR